MASAGNDPPCFSRRAVDSAHRKWIKVNFWQRKIGGPMSCFRSAQRRTHSTSDLPSRDWPRFSRLGFWTRRELWARSSCSKERSAMMPMPCSKQSSAPARPTSRRPARWTRVPSRHGGLQWARRPARAGRDSSRAMKARLFATRMFWQTEGQSQWNFLFEGKWQRLRLLTVTRPGGGPDARRPLPNSSLRKPATRPHLRVSRPR